MSDIDQRFRAERLQRQIAEIEERERQASHRRHLQRIRAEFSKPTKTIHVDGPIGQEPGEISAKWFRSQLPSDGSPIRVSFHSEGGSLFEAFAIYDLVEGYKGRKKATVESMAFSAASMLLCAFDEVDVTPNGYVMIHSPHIDGGDDLEDSQQRLLAQLRDKMVGIYTAKTGKPRSFIEKEVEREVFYDADASVSLGIATRISPASSAVVARLPQRVLAKLQASKLSARAQWQTAVDSAAKTMPRADAVKHVDTNNPGLRQRMLAEVNKR